MFSALRGGLTRLPQRFPQPVWVPHRTFFKSAYDDYELDRIYEVAFKVFSESEDKEGFALPFGDDKVHLAPDIVQTHKQEIKEALCYEERFYRGEVLLFDRVIERLHMGGSEETYFAAAIATAMAHQSGLVILQYLPNSALRYPIVILPPKE